MIGVLILVMLAYFLWNLENSAPPFDVVGEVLHKDVAYPAVYSYPPTPEPLERYYLVIKIGKGEKVGEVQVEVSQKLFGLVKEGGVVIPTCRRGLLTGRLKILEVT